MYMYKLLSTLIMTLLYQGCGGDRVISDTPHTNIHQQTEKARTPVISNPQTISSREENETIKIGFSADSDLSGIEDIKHFQIYLNTDDNNSTGFSDGPIAYNGIKYEIIGADYMIEDNRLYKSTSNSLWKWDLVSDITTNNFDTIIEDSGRISIYKREYIFPSSLIEGTPSYVYISVEPLDINYKDTNNFVPTKKIEID